jgi:hypothetical protein
VMPNRLTEQRVEELGSAPEATSSSACAGSC